MFMIFDQYLAIYTVFHQESESEDQIDQFLDPEEKIKED